MSSPRRPAEVVLALGLNVPPRRRRWQRLTAALAHLPGSRLLAVSEPLASAAVGPGVDGLFLNGVAVLTTHRTPRVLLDDLKRLEQRLGRRRRDHGNRPADLDILLWRDGGGRWRRFALPALRVPHPRMLDRPFVLAPLAKLALPDLPPAVERRLAALRRRATSGLSAS